MAASHAADACQAMSCASPSKPAALWGSTRSRSGTSTCASSQSINATRSAVKTLYNSVMARGDVVIANSHYTADLIRNLHPDQAGDRVRVNSGVIER